MDDIGDSIREGFDRAPLTKDGVRIVGVIEVANMDWVTAARWRASPDPDKLMAEAVAVLKAHLKEVLEGLAPFLTRDLIRTLVEEVMAEDFNGTGPQTVRYSDYEDGVPAEVAVPFRERADLRQRAKQGS